MILFYPPTLLYSLDIFLNQPILHLCLSGPQRYNKAGNKTVAVINDAPIVVRKRIPNLFKIATLHTIKKTPEKQEVSAPPRMVGPI
jgi:hypothetical protein